MPFYELNEAIFFSKHQQLTKRIGYFANRSQRLFQKEEATSWSNIVNKKYIT